ncbi:hypothetical protein GC175_24640 [bacterium]|nr:hypothetical protein [bacterium]
MTPKLQVDAIHKVFDNGNHNAFTDLCRFRDHIYLTFRTCPDGHMLFTSSRIVVLRSQDGQEWTQVHLFGVPKRDVRDPHFLVFGDKLFVYTGTWWVDPHDSSERDINDHLGFAAWSEDGLNWHDPVLLNGTHGHYIWRAGAHNDIAYLDARRIANFDVVAERERRQEQTESWLLYSTDGFNWTPAGCMLPHFGGETSFVFEDDDSITALIRSGAAIPAWLCRSDPPYAEWTYKQLTREVGGPLLVRWGEHYLVGGRNRTAPGGPVTTLYWLIDDELCEVTTLPSGGDTSYPGFVALSPTHGLLSYYSSHEGSGTSLAPSAIYLANLKISDS